MNCKAHEEGGKRQGGSGFSVFPTEVEDLLYRHPAIAEVSVIGVPDPYRGEAPKAFIVLRPEYKGKIKEEEIVEWAKDNMATYKRPRMVEFRDELPKSAAGKILRRVLVEEEKLRTESISIIRLTKNESRQLAWR